MKKLMALFLILLTLIFTGCGDAGETGDKCDDMDCGANAYCIEANGAECVCNDGYHFEYGECVEDSNPYYTDDGLPVRLEDFMSEYDIEALENEGMDIYKGSTPPDITGDYLLDTLSIYYDSNGYTIDGYFSNYTYVFFNQNQYGDIEYTFTNPDGSSVGGGYVSYISGSGNCFSIFANESRNREDCYTESPSIISGCIDSYSGNITGFKSGFIITERQGECVNIMGVGQMRIIYEEDGVAEYQY